MSGEQHVIVLEPVHLVHCSECGRGVFAESHEQHPTYGTIFHCTWGGCASEGVTLGDIQLEAGERLTLVTTEAGLTIGYREIISETVYI